MAPSFNPTHVSSFNPGVAPSPTARMPSSTATTAAAPAASPVAVNFGFPPLIPQQAPSSAVPSVASMPDRSSSRKAPPSSLQAAARKPVVPDPAIAAQLMAQMGTSQDDEGTSQDDDFSVDSRKLESPASKKNDPFGDMELDATIEDLQREGEAVAQDLENLMMTTTMDMETEKTPGQNKRTKDQSNEPQQPGVLIKNATVQEFLAHGKKK